MDLTVIALMRNVEPTFDTTLARFRRELDRLGVRWELILVDDGSRDGTRALAEQRAAAAPDLRVLSGSFRRATGEALQRAFAEAGGHFVITTGFDPKYSPDQIPRLLHVLTGDPEADVVVASCHHPDGRIEGFSPWRRRLKRWRNQLFRLVLRNRLHTSGCIFRGYRRAALEQLRLSARGEEIHLEILAQAFALGLGVRETPAVERFIGHAPWRRGARQGLRTLRFVVAERPALVHGSLGLAMSVIGAVGVSMGSLARLRSDSVVEPLALPTFGMLALIGIQIVLLAFLADQQRGVAALERHRSARQRRGERPGPRRD